jgi:DNA gyrase/topoisomerase IV subunit A
MQLEAELEAARLSNMKLDRFADSCLVQYGTYVIESRALPDFRDGMKPVHRRILWAMKKYIGSKHTGGTVKSARVVGDVIGRLNPHGDQAAYNAAITLVNQMHPTIIGQGNLGEFNSRPASMRYSEVKLSKYADHVLLDADYLHESVTDYMPNYNGEEIEPVCLPSLLPNLLLNGSEGIAVGIASGMPVFQPKGVAKLLQKAYSGKQISVADCADHLVVEYGLPFNSKVLSTKEELTEFYKTGRGRLKLGVNYKTDGSVMLIEGFPIHFEMEAAVDKLQEKVEEAASVNDLSDKHGNKLRIILKPAIPVDERRKVFEQCAKLLEGGINLNMVCIERLDAETVKVHASWNMPKFFEEWAKWRLELERRVNRHLRDVLLAEIARQRLTILAFDNLDFLVKLARQKIANEDAEAAIVKQLSVNLESAKQIWSMSFRNLNALNKDKLLAEIKLKKRQVEIHKNHIKQPGVKLLAELDTAIKAAVPYADLYAK